MFNPVGVLPTYLQAVTTVKDETHLLVFTPYPELVRAELLQWLDSEFFPYEELPYVMTAARQDVAVIRTGCLPKPILITIVHEGKV